MVPQLQVGVDRDDAGKEREISLAASVSRRESRQRTDPATPTEASQRCCLSTAALQKDSPNLEGANEEGVSKRLEVSNRTWAGLTPDTQRLRSSLKLPTLQRFGSPDIVLRPNLCAEGL